MSFLADLREATRLERERLEIAQDTERAVAAQLERVREAAQLAHAALPDLERIAGKAGFVPAGAPAPAPTAPTRGSGGGGGEGSSRTAGTVPANAAAQRPSRSSSGGGGGEGSSRSGTIFVPQSTGGSPPPVSTGKRVSADAEYIAAVVRESNRLLVEELRRKATGIESRANGRGF